MAYLAVLLANPGTEISALELVGGPGLRQTPPVAAAGEAAGGPLSGQMILDDLQRVIGSRGAAADVGDSCDSERARAALAERAWLLTQLRSATGPAGRRRVFATDEERARVSVGKAIRRALARITALDQQLGALISADVRTGRVCAYAPPRKWRRHRTIRVNKTPLTAPGSRSSFVL